MLGGLVAGEGSFCITHPSRKSAADGWRRKRFIFNLSMATRDRPLVESLHGFLGVGGLRDEPSRRTGLLPITTLTVNSVRAHRAAVIPFADRYLLRCAKRRQFEAWRDEMKAYWAALPPKHR